ncbi:MAG: S1 RNA-binding domain-containing protein [Candidatus Margulisiibacteriota bacterium]
MAEEFKGTFIDKGKGENEYFEVEELIRQTLEENKKVETPKAGAETPVLQSEFQATTLKQESPLPVKPELINEAPKAPKSEYENTFNEYRVGDIVKGKILKIDQTGALVDIKYKADGIIPTEELSEKSSGLPVAAVKVGEIVDVYIDNLENKEGYVVLSKNRADFEKKWKLASDALHNKTLLEGKVIQVLRGGLVVDCNGIRGFIPASQVSKQAEESLEAFANKTIPVKVLEANQRQGKIILSHKMAAGDHEKQSTNKIWDEVEVGQVRHGKVMSLKNFGAFVDIGGVEGLIHLTELSWKRVKHPSEVLKSGQEIDVFVLGVDKVNKKVSLGLKELLPDPWEKASQLFKPGQIVKAKILRFVKFGAFAELEGDLEGLIHVSELSKEPFQKMEDAVKIGEVVDVKVLRVLPEEQKIGLSIREVQLDKDRAALKEATIQPEEKKVTIGDMMAEKERAREEENLEEGIEEAA